MSKTYDVAIIGAGPGGYVAAILAAQKGLTTCVVEKAELGGVCLNWGCIPSKSLIHNASKFLAARELEKFGVAVETNGFRYEAVHAASRTAASTLSRGIAALLEKNKIEVFRAKATLLRGKKISLEGPASSPKSISSSSVIIATGSQPAALPGFAFDEKHILSSTGALSLTHLPGSLVILGAGAIGCEFAYVMNAFGVKVTLVEIANRILPNEDVDAARILQAEFQKSGIEVVTGARALSWKRTSSSLSVEIERVTSKSQFGCDQILVAAGRIPNTKGLGLEAAGVDCDGRGYVITRSHYETTSPGIYAIGDVIDTPALAHVASKEAEIVIDRITGRQDSPARVDPAGIPSAIYCEPQVAGFGLHEEAATTAGLKVKKSIFPFRAAGKAVAIGETVGQVKILADCETGEILGGHIVGHNATEIIHELLLAKTGEMTVQDLTHMIHAHPTFSEAVREAALAVSGRPIHV
jgi:dihydrolipoamide dehydrogenase